jgi:hypothetical protein
MTKPVHKGGDEFAHPHDNNGKEMKTINENDNNIKFNIFLILPIFNN